MGDAMTTATPAPCATLEARLHVGWDRIAAVENAGQDATAMEDFWLGLLAEYERCCRHLDAVSATLSRLNDAAPVDVMGITTTAHDKDESPYRSTEPL